MLPCLAVVASAIIEFLKLPLLSTYIHTYIHTPTSQIFDPNIENISGGELADTNVIVVGCTRLLCESPVAQNIASWTVLFKALLSLLVQSSAGTSSSVEAFLEDEDAAESRQFDSTFSKLTYAHIPPPVSVPEVAQPAMFFANSLGALSAKVPGQYTTVIDSCFDPSDANDVARATYFQGLLGSANVTLAR